MDCDFCCLHDISSFNYTKHTMTLRLFGGVGYWMWIACIVVYMGDYNKKIDDTFIYPPHPIPEQVHVVHIQLV